MNRRCLEVRNAMAAVAPLEADYFETGGREFFGENGAGEADSDDDHVNLF